MTNKYPGPGEYDSETGAVCSEDDYEQEYDEDGNEVL